MSGELHAERETGLAEDVDPTPLQGEVTMTGEVTLEPVHEDAGGDEEEDE